MRKGDTILTVNGIDMSDPSQGILALAEARRALLRFYNPSRKLVEAFHLLRTVLPYCQASTVVIKGQRGTEEVAAAATKVQAIFRGDKVRKKGHRPPKLTEAGSWCVPFPSPFLQAGIRH